jgi:hypothetical protein
MMTTLTFDTLKVADRLEASGFTREQAKGAAVTFAEIAADNSGKLVTVEHFDAKMRELDGKFRELELRMTIKLGGMLLAITGIMAALLKYFLP